MGNGRARQAGRCVCLVWCRRRRRCCSADGVSAPRWRRWLLCRCGERASASAGAGARGSEAGVIQPRLCLALSIVARSTYLH